MKSIRTFDFRKMVLFAGGGLVALLGGYLIRVAVLLRVDLFDSYGLFLNARQIVYGFEFPYYPRGTPALSLLYGLFFAVGDLRGWEAFGVLAARVSAVLFFLGLALASYRFFSLGRAVPGAVAGALLLAFNPLLIHYAPFPKEDIPGVLFLTLAFYNYLQWRGEGQLRIPVAGMVWAALAGVTRHNLFIVIPAVVLAYEVVLTWRSGKSLRERGAWLLKTLLAFVVAPFLIGMVFPVAAYGISGRSPWFVAPFLFVKDILSHFSFLKEYQESGLEAYVFLVKACGWPAVILAVVGVAVTWIRKNRTGVFCFLWFVVIFLLQGHIIQHREARLFFPAYVPFYFLAVTGIMEFAALAARVFRFSARSRKRFAAGLAAVMLTLSAGAAVKECLKFRDPFYRYPLAEKVADAAVRLAGPHSIFWAGGYYPHHPKDYVFDHDDESTYLYHLYEHTMRFWIGHQIPVIQAEAFSASSGESSLFFKSAGPILNDGDVLIAHAETQIATRDVPRMIGPLIVQRVRKIIFRPIVSEGDCVFFRSLNGNPRSGIALCRKGKDSFFRGWGLPERDLDLFFQCKGKKVIGSPKVSKPSQGDLSLQIRGDGDWDLAMIEEIGIIFYDQIERF